MFQNIYHTLLQVQQERLGRSIDRLSKDLYSKDTHFVLELIQNADDNSYHEDLLDESTDNCPSVKFVIDRYVVFIEQDILDKHTYYCPSVKYVIDKHVVFIEIRYTG